MECDEKKSIDFRYLKIEYIKEHFKSDKDRQQIEFTKVLEEEIRLLNEIEKKRNKIRREAHDKHMDKLLDKMGAPVKWIGYKSNSQKTCFYFLSHRLRQPHFANI